MLKIKFIAFSILFSCTVFAGISTFNALYAVVSPALNNLNTQIEAVNK